MTSRPLYRMRSFASLLGWHGLQLDSFKPWPEGIAAEKGLDRIYLYQTPDDKFNLQINEHPLDQTTTHKATIKADRYGVIRIDWDTSRCLRAVAT